MAERQWYVARGGRTYGPFSSDQMGSGARNGELTRDDLVWCAGMAHWLPAGQLPELWPTPELPPKPRQPATAPESAPRPEPAATAAAGPEAVQQPAAAQMASAARRRGVILRHWRGELSLAWSYWGVGILATAAALIAAAGYGAAMRGVNLAPVTVGIANLAFLTLICALAVWQLVGIWRAAGNHVRAGRRKLWAVLARIAVVVGAARAAVDFATIIGPMLSESAMLAAGRDNIPAYQLRLLRNGTELELAGGMPFGTADALRKLLDTAPGVKVLHLNSIGGRVSEGFQIYQLVRDRNLTTYTAADCVSACTIAFLGGSQRYLSSKARLGFHSLSFGGVDQSQIPGINADLRHMLAQHGAPQWFIDKALSTSADSMWYPVTDDLIAARIVTQVVDPDRFALSGLGGWGDRDAVERGLLRNPLYALIKESDPAGFRRLADRFSEAVRQGKSGPELIEDVQAVFGNEVLPQYLRVAPDAVLQRYWRTQVAEMEHMSNSDPANCVGYAFPEARRAGFNINKLVPPALLADDMAALTDLVAQAIRDPQRQSAGDVDAEVAGAVGRISAGIPRASDVLAQPQAYFNDPATLCRALIAFYADILRLPPARSGAVLRALAASAP